MVKKISFIILFFSFFLSGIAFAQNISVSASTDTTDYLVGDYVHYNIQVAYKKGTQVQQPILNDSLSGAELIKVEQPLQSENGNKENVIYRFVLSKYDSGGVTIPPIPIKYKLAGQNNWQTITTNDVQFTVHTMQVSTRLDIKDVKQPIRIPLDWKIILLWILIIGLVIAAAIYFYRKYKKKHEGIVEKKVVKIPAHLKALSALRELESENLWQKGMIKEYHSRITEIIRKYFDERFNLHAMELTTNEVMDLLRTKNEAQVIFDITNDFLNNADLVKFAKFQPMSSINEEMMKQAFSIVNKTVPKVEEPKEEVTEDVQ